MNPHDEQLRAEQLDAFLDEPSGELPDFLDPQEAAVARLLARSAERMAPDPAFARQLEQRLRALHGPTGTPRATGRAPWLAALLTPLERVAWVAIMALLIGGFIAGIRVLSQALPAQQATPPPLASATPPLTLTPTIPPPVGTAVPGTPVAPATVLPPPAPVIIGTPGAALPTDLLGEARRYTLADPLAGSELAGSVWLRLHESGSSRLVAVQADGRTLDLPSMAPPGWESQVVERLAVDASPTGRFVMELTGITGTTGYHLSFYDRASGAGIAYELPATTSISVGEALSWSETAGAAAFLLGDAMSGQSFIAWLALPSGELRLLPMPLLAEGSLLPAWVGDSLLLFGWVEAERGQLYRLSLADGSATLLLDRRMSALAVSPDGSRVAMLANEGEQTNLVLYDLTTGQERSLPANGQSAIRLAGTLAWAPDSSAVAVAVNKAPSQADPTAAAWLHVVARDGTTLAIWPESISAARPMIDSFWGADGEILVAFSGGITDRTPGRLRGWRRSGETIALSRNLVELPALLGGDALAAALPGGVQAAPPPPFLAGERFVVESVSPDGRYIAYREVSNEAWQEQSQSQQLAQGTFHLYDTVRQQECSRVAEPRPRLREAEQTLFWLPPPGTPGEFIIVLANGGVLSSYPCADEAARLDDFFPEPPLEMEPLDSEGRRWVVRTASGLALWDRSTLDPIRPIAYLPPDATRYLISPDRSRLAVTLLESDPWRESLYLVDIEVATARLVATWRAVTYADGTVAPRWVGNRQLLVAETADRGPLLLTLDGAGAATVEELMSTRFRLPIPPTPEPSPGGPPAIIYRAVPVGSGEEPHLLLIPIGPNEGVPPRLYHPDGARVEELLMGQVVEGRGGEGTLLFVRGTAQPGRPDETEPYTLWRRDLEAIGEEPTEIPDLALPLTWATTAAWSSDGAQLLTPTTTPGELVLVDLAAGRLLRRWQSEGEGLTVVAWPAQGRAALVQGRVGDSDRLWLLPLD